MEINTYESSLKKYFGEGIETFIPQVSTNCVVFKYDHPHLKVLFHNMPEVDQWFLPGGYVKIDETLEESAYRNLKYSGIDQVFLRQVHTFSEIDRIQNLPENTINFFSNNASILEWVKKRFITVVYYGLVAENQNVNRQEVLFEGAKWIDVNQLKKIGLDHENITNEIRKILAIEILNFPIASNLLPEHFTLNELRGLFEAILNRTIDRGTFRRKMLKLGVIEQFQERKESKGRPSHLYRFNQPVYDQFLKAESKFGF